MNRRNGRMSAPQSVRSGLIWQVPLGCGLAAMVAYFLLPTGGLAQTWVFVAVQGCVVVALAAGTRAHRPARALFWKVLLVGQAVCFVANVLWYVSPPGGEALSFPSAADPLYALSYLFTAAALALLVRVRVGAFKRVDLVDASIITLGIVLVIWVFQLQPTLSLSGLTAVGEVFTLAYPLLSLLMLAMVVRLVVGGGTRGPAFWLLVGSTVVQLVADIGYSRAVVGGTVTGGAPHFGALLFSYLLLAIAALHPSMRDVATPTVRPRQTTIRRRLPLLAVASLIGPMVILVQVERDAPINLALVVLVTSVIFLLVLSRVSELMVDVAEHERVQEQLSRLALIVESSEDAILGWDADFTITSWNAGATRMFGYSAEEMVGGPSTRLAPPDWVEHREDILHRVLTGGRVGSFDSVRLKKDGTIVDVSVTASAIRDASGAVIGGATIARDITEHKRLEARLASARDEALAVSRLKSEFLATMSHEIRTPMNGVIGLSGLLLNTELDGRQRQYVEGVQGAGEALLAVINDVLDFSKIEAGKLTLEVVDLDLVQVVEDAAGLLAEPARVKGLELLAYCLPDLRTALRGDPGRLRQVLINLLSNAVKFTATGEVVLRARMVEETDHDVLVRFEVADSGIGIHAADTRRLFEPFSQADASTTRRYGGTGLGLAICTRLVSAMGGDLAVDSVPGEGSTFWFTIRLQRQTAEPVALRPFHHLLQGVRVLVVDDNETNRLFLHDQLEAWEMRPDVTDNARSALEALRRAMEDERPYSLALIDMCMPDMDGLELARHVRADARLASTKLVMQTSLADIDAAAEEAGIASSLTKPLRHSQLYDCLMRVTAPVCEVSQPVGRVPAGRGFRGRVLVVEDNPTNQMVALGILDELRYQADVAGNGLEALQALDRGEYAAVLMDCQMPEMDGFTATAEIRRREGATRRTPIIAMTAGAVDGAREECLAAGMDDYISKPVKPEDVELALERWLAGRIPVGRAEPDLDSATPDTVVDQARLGVLRKMGPPNGSFLVTLVDAFLSEASTGMAVLHDAVGSDDRSGLHQGAHRLRGSAANLGATGMATLCRDLESLGRTGELSAAPDLLRLLEAELDLVTLGLRAAVSGAAT